MDIFKELLALFISTEQRFSTKAATFIVILLGLILANNLFGFTYYYNINNKIEKISAINKILEDSTITSRDKLELTKIREEVLDRVTVLEAIGEKISIGYAQLKGANLNVFKSKTANKNSEAQVSSRNNTWFLLSTSGVYILFVLVLIPIGFIGVIQSKEPANGILGLFVLAIIMYGIGAFNYYVLNLIPQLGHDGIWNYALNVALQLLALGFMAFASARVNKR